jgi:hypothetical protein
MSRYFARLLEFQERATVEFLRTRIPRTRRV